MKEFVIISGKGGTGKTSITASFAYLAKNIVVADCDVDAANLALVLTPYKQESNKFIGGKKAQFIGDNTDNCNCTSLCRFGAISSDCSVDKYSCEGCGACHVLCPENYSFESVECGEWYIGNFSDNKYMAYAELYPGEDNSGKLSTLVRNQAALLAKKYKIDTVLIDGPPGIGCPVIASITGADKAIIVTEPTMSGLHDLERAFKLCEHLKVPVSIIVNKGDLNPEYAKNIKSFCYERGLEFLGIIGYEPKFHDALSEAKTIVEYCPECTASKDIRKIFEKIF
jgi:MinD superfamily P-loop ATPase